MQSYFPTPPWAKQNNVNFNFVFGVSATFMNFLEDLYSRQKIGSLSFRNFITRKISKKIS